MAFIAVIVVLGVAIFRKDLQRNTRIVLFVIGGLGMVAAVAVLLALTV